MDLTNAKRAKIVWRPSVMHRVFAIQPIAMFAQSAVRLRKVKHIYVATACQNIVSNCLEGTGAVLPVRTIAMLLMTMIMYL